MVLGRKRLYASPSIPLGTVVGRGIDLSSTGMESEEGNSNDALAEDEPKEVFGAVRRNPNPSRQRQREEHDEFSIIHRILHQDDDAGTADSAGSQR